MIINYKKYIKENINSDIDLFGEEDWEDKYHYLVRAINQNNRIIFLATFVLNEDEAMEKFTKETGCTTEYGPLRFEIIDANDITNMLRLKRRRLNQLSDEDENLRIEVDELSKNIN